MNATVKVYRGTYVESTHNAHVAVVDHTGALLYHHGDPHRLTFARSAMKPFQTIPVIETGAAHAFRFQPEHIALCCASHNGEPLQRSRVLEMLEKIGLTENDLQCGTHVPRDTDSYRALILDRKDLTPVFSNCSGKHTGMLATTVHMHEDAKTYTQSEHPVQQRITETISDLCEHPRDQIATAVDGCGVPVHRLPLHAIALGFAKLASPGKLGASLRVNTAEAIVDAMVTHPDMVAGKNRLDTDLMRVYNGRLFAKGGAEAVQCIGDRERGIGIAIKMEDGGSRALCAVAMSVLKQLKIGDDGHFEQLQRYVHPSVDNMRGEQVGVIKSDFTLSVGLPNEITQEESRNVHK